MKFFEEHAHLAHLGGRRAGAVRDRSAGHALGELGLGTAFRVAFFFERRQRVAVEARRQLYVDVLGATHDRRFGEAFGARAQVGVEEQARGGGVRAPTRRV